MEQIVRFGEVLEDAHYRIRPGVYAVIINRESEDVAAVKTSTGHFLPGGGIEGTESHEECLKRECLEEIGCEIDIGKSIGRAKRYFYSTTNHEYMVSDGYFYLVSITSQSCVPIEDDHEFVWIKRNDVTQLLFLEHQAWAAEKGFNECDLA